MPHPLSSPPRLKKVLLVACVLVSVFGSACSATATSSNVTQGGFAANLAQQMPAPTDDVPFWMTFTNFELAMTELGFQATGSCDGSQSDQALYLDQLTEAALAGRFAGPGVMRILIEGDDPDEFHARLGFSWCDVKASSTFPQSPHLDDVFFSVDASTNDISTAVRADEVWNDLLETESVDGGQVYNWGTDHYLERRSSLRPLGLGGYVGAFDNATVAVVRDPELLDQLIDNGADRLIEVEGVSEILAQLTDARSYSIAVSNHVLPAELRVQGDETLDFEPLAPWLMRGVGIGLDGDNDVLHLALHHGTEADAQINAERLRSNLAQSADRSGIPLTEIYQVDRIEFDGTMVTATLIVLGDELATWRASSLSTDLLLVQG